MSGQSEVQTQNNNEYLKLFLSILCFSELENI